MNRIEFTANDFIKDEYFQRWVFSPDEETELFWKSFLEKNPHKHETIREARQFLKVFTETNDNRMETRIRALKNRIDHAIDNGSVVTNQTVHVSKAPEIKANQSTTNRFFSLGLAIAASVSLLIASVTFMIPENSIMDFFSGVKTHTTSRGHRTVITLEDGTQVWLNAESKLRHPRTFVGKATREVVLEGEAFFKVSHNPKQPFIVHTSDIDVKVLGTSFNVKAYANQRHIETALVEGKVTILSKEGNSDAVTLKPNELAVFTKETKAIVLSGGANTESISSWKEGNLNFDDAPVEEILDALERWFDVTIHAQDRASLQCRFSAKVENKTLEEVLELFEASNGITFKIEGKEVFINGSLCQE